MFNLRDQLKDLPFLENLMKDSPLIEDTLPESRRPPIQVLLSFEPPQRLRNACALVERSKYRRMAMSKRGIEALVRAASSEYLEVIQKLQGVGLLLIVDDSSGIPKFPVGFELHPPILQVEFDGVQYFIYCEK